MQLLEIESDKYIHYIRYGRLGELGKPTYRSYDDKQVAKTAFEKQFRLKTGNKWATRKNFVKKANKYFLSEISYEDGIKEKPENKKRMPPSKLHKKVQKLIRMISDIKMMTNTLVELDIDTKKLPLGKLRQTQLDKAKKILDEIEQVIVTKDEEKVIDLSSMYYTYIPNGCGRRKPPIITQELVTKYREILEDLSNIIIGVKVINNVAAEENPIDSIYKDINTIIKSLRRNSVMHKELVKYVDNTHGSTHGCRLEVLEIYDIEQAGKREI